MASFFSAIGAATGRRWRELGQGHTLQFRRLLHETEQARVNDAVVDEPPGPAAFEQASLAQSHQVLGEVSLPPPEGGFEMADADLAFADGQQDLQAGFLADGLEKGGDQ